MKKVIWVSLVSAASGGFLLANVCMAAQCSVATTASLVKAADGIVSTIKTTGTLEGDGNFLESFSDKNTSAQGSTFHAVKSGPDVDVLNSALLSDTGQILISVEDQSVTVAIDGEKQTHDFSSFVVSSQTFIPMNDGNQTGMHLVDLNVEVNCTQ